mgnify:CR=1 FL=1
MMPADYTDAFACGVEAWSGFWGDPLFSGTLMIATYAFAALLAWRVAMRMGGVQRGAWVLAAVLMAFQALNTPLDLHGLMWATGRCLAHIQEWYADRYAYQRELLIGLAIVFAVLVILGVLVLRKHLLAHGLLVVGLALSLGMTLVKGINYHHLEALYQARVGPLHIPDIIELAGITCVFLATRLIRRV